VAVPPVRTALPVGLRAWPAPDEADPLEPALDEPAEDELEPEGRRTA